MSKLMTFLLLLSLSVAVSAREAEIGSKFNVKQTAERYINALEKAGVQVLRNEIAKNSITGKPEARVVFANPMFGTRIGECHKGVRKDIPMTTTIREDGSQRVSVIYELADAKTNNFGVIECGNETDNLNRTLNGFASSAAE